MSSQVPEGKHGMKIKPESHREKTTHPGRVVLELVRASVTIQNTEEQPCLPREIQLYSCIATLSQQIQLKYTCIKALIQGTEL